MSAALISLLRTGYQNMRELNKKIFGEDVIEATSEVHGLDEEGELRGTHRPTGHPGVSTLVTSKISK